MNLPEIIRRSVVRNPLQNKEDLVGLQGTAHRRISAQKAITPEGPKKLDLAKRLWWRCGLFQVNRLKGYVLIFLEDCY